MNIAFLCSNAVAINKHTKKGTEIFDRILLPALAKHETLKISAFASGDSDLPVPIESTDSLASAEDATMPREKYIMFELALLSKAFVLQNKFDLYHVNIGDGDLAMPFAAFVKKPMLVTLHNLYNLPYVSRYFSLFREMSHVYFVSPSNAMRALLPDVQYLKTIYHGIEEDIFAFDGTGGESMLWAGRGIPTKGLPDAITIADRTDRTLAACIIKKPEHSKWLLETLQKAKHLHQKNKIEVVFDMQRADLIERYQKSKLFLFPISWEEPFGLVMVESLSCGTPVVAYARGAAPEIIVDGKTGFLVNPSEEDIRGDYIIKKTGVEGLIEAVQKIYALPDTEYRAMRRSCRERVEEKFTAKRMANDYAAAYQELVEKHTKNLS